MVSRMKELEQLTLKGRKPTSNILKALQRKLAGKGNLTNTEKRKLKALQRQARKSVDIENQFRNAPSLDVTITKDRKLPTGRGGTEPLFKKDGSPRLGSSKKKKPIRSTGSDGAKDRASTPTVNQRLKKLASEAFKSKPIRKKGSSAARDRANIKTAITPKQRPTGRGSTTSLMPKTYTIKAGDTLTSIAKKMNTTVAMLKAANNIKDANKIRAGAKLKLYRDANKPTTKPKDTRPRTIAQAQKMGKKYFFDKNGKRKAAVTAEQLKKSGLTLAQWLKKK